MPNAEIEGMNMAVKSTHSWVRVGTAASVAAVMALGTVPAAAFAGEANAGETAFEQAADQTTASVVLPEGWTAWQPSVVEGEQSYPVYYDGKYYADMKTAVEIANEANSTEAAVIYCQPGVAVNFVVDHLEVSTSIVVYGNGAYGRANEAKAGEGFSVDTYANGGKGLQKDISIEINNLSNATVWGQRKTAHKVDVVLKDCNYADRVYLSGVQKGSSTNITIENCTFYGSDVDGKTGSAVYGGCAVYSNAVGTINLENCTFNGVREPINLNNKSGANQTISVTGCAFNDCATTDLTSKEAEWASVVRVVSSVAGSTSDLSVNGCTFAYSGGKQKTNGDILLGEGRAGKASHPVTVSVSNTAAEVHVHNPGDSTEKRTSS